MSSAGKIFPPAHTQWECWGFEGLLLHRGTAQKRALGSFKVTQPAELCLLCAKTGESLFPLLPLPLSFYGSSIFPPHSFTVWSWEQGRP